MSKILDAYELVDDVLSENYGTIRKVNNMVDSTLESYTKKYHLHEEEITLDTFKDYIDHLKSLGFDNEEKLNGMLDRAKEIAKEQGKEGDPKTVLGIMQAFMMGK